MMGTHGRYILDRNGDLDIPYMDRALADRILAVDEQVLRDVMADVLEPWAIDALCTRFQQVKDAIQKDQQCGIAQSYRRPWHDDCIRLERWSYRVQQQGVGL